MFCRNLIVSQISQWLSVVLQGNTFEATPAVLKDLDAQLTARSFAAGHQLTVADVALWQAVWPAVAGAGASAAAWPALVRWGNTVAAQLLAAGVSDLPAPAQLELPTPAVQFTWSTTPAPAPAAAAAAAAAPAAKGDAAGSKKADKKGEKKAKGDAAAAAGGDKKKDAKADGKKKGDKGAAAPAGGAADAGMSTIGVCQFLVGKVLKAWPHPEAERLYVEEIDVGEEQPRTICSGLREHVALEELQGALVIVAANLKPRPLVGIPSAGMVLCASDPEAGKVELLKVPEGAKPGERVVFEGYMGEPATGNQMAKKKVLEKVLPDLTIRADGSAAWQSVPFMTSAGPVTARTLKKGRVG